MEHLIWIIREGRIPCLFHELTGFYCPGCGGTRAVLALLAGHPVLSFLYHPLVPYCALVALVFAVSYAIYWIPGSGCTSAMLTYMWDLGSLSLISW